MYNSLFWNVTLPTSKHTILSYLFISGKSLNKQPSVKSFSNH